MTLDDGMTPSDYQMLVEDCERYVIQLVQRDNKIMALKERISELKEQRRSMIIELEELRHDDNSG